MTVRNAWTCAALRDDRNRDAAKAGKDSKHKGIWYYKHGYAVDQSSRGRPTWSAVVVAPPAGAGKAPPRPVSIYRKDPDPFFALHQFESEEEAALAYDHAMLWLLLRTKGCTEAQLRGHAWNLPQLQLWAKKSLLSTLPKYDLSQVKKVQTIVRSHVRGSLPTMLDLGLLTAKRAASFKRHQKHLEERRKEWRKEEALTPKERREKEQREAANARRWAGWLKSVRKARQVEKQRAKQQEQRAKERRKAAAARKCAQEQQREAARAAKLAAKAAAEAAKVAARAKHAAAAEKRKREAAVAQAARRQAVAAAAAHREQRRQREARLAARRAARS